MRPLLRAPSDPDATADVGQHEFTYTFHVWSEGFINNPVIREALELNTPIPQAAGAVGTFFILLTSSNANIIFDTVKIAEDGSGHVIARLPVRSEDHSNHPAIKRSLAPPTSPMLKCEVLRP
ncbi:hypothetical protein AB4Z21_01605 [Paenibacillus sp. MCAF20]